MQGFGRSLIALPSGRQRGGDGAFSVSPPPAKGLDLNLLFSQGSRAQSIGAGGWVGRRRRGESEQQGSTCVQGGSGWRPAAA